MGKEDTISDSDQSFSSDDEAPYLRWKENIPYLYDCFYNHNLEWPCHSFCWGPVTKQHKKLTRQNLILSQSTDAVFDPLTRIWRGSPNTIEIYTAKLAHPTTELPNKLKQFNEEDSCSNLLLEKRIIHPGEVTRMKSFRRNPSVLVTHSNCKETFVWDTEVLDSRSKKVDQKAHEPFFVLLGHVGDANYALDISENYKIASGGEDGRICIWDLEGKLAKKTKNSIEENFVKPFLELTNHEKEVLEVAFHPQRETLLASCGSDKKLLIWDLKEATNPVITFKDAQKYDTNTVSWNFYYENILAIGTEDSRAKVLDIRKYEETKDYEMDEKMEGNVIYVTFNSVHTDFLAAADAEGELKLFNYLSEESDKKVFFKHAGHRSPVSCVEWNHQFNNKNQNDWMLASTSNDSEVGLGGGTFQIWRILDWLYKDDDESLFDIQRIMAMNQNN